MNLITLVKMNSGEVERVVGRDLEPEEALRIIDQNPDQAIYPLTDKQNKESYASK